MIKETCRLLLFSKSEAEYGFDGERAAIAALCMSYDILAAKEILQRDANSITPNFNLNSFRPQQDAFRASWLYKDLLALRDSLLSFDGYTCCSFSTRASPSESRA